MYFFYNTKKKNDIWKLLYINKNMTRYCKGDDCKGKKKRASYNFAGMKPKYCNNCKLPDMIDVVSRPKCTECKLKIPSYNFAGMKGKYCNNCKEPDMIDVVNPKCIICNLKRPSYNFAGLNPEYCNNCKLPNMIDVRNPKCIKCNSKIPAFNLPSESKALYCGDCKLPNMIDVVSPKCTECNLKQAIYNFAGMKGKYCNNCKLPDMINVVSSRCIDCKLKIPNFNLPTESKGLYCNNCKLPDMIDVVNQKCITNLCQQYSRKDKYCWRCYYFHNPTKRPKRLKVKEEEVLNYLKEHFKDINLITDKALIGDGICLKNRPDLLIHLNKHSVIIEIDENQHKWYEKSCDDARINNIQEALNRPIIIIRFNPDAYTENGKKIKSCFKNDEKTGLKTIPKNQEQNWNNRLLKLKETLSSSIYDYTDEPIRIIKLYYDN